MIDGLTPMTSPTNPSSGCRAPASMSPASWPDRPTASGPVHVERRDDVAVDLADEHHLRDLERLGVGDAVAVDELGALAQPAQPVADLRATTVYDDGAHRRRNASSRCPERTARTARASSIALPPNFTTILAPWNCWMYGNACRRTSTSYSWVARAAPRSGSCRVLLHVV